MSKALANPSKEAKLAPKDDALELPLEMWNLVVMCSVESSHWLLIVPNLLLTSKAFHSLVVRYVSAVPMANSLSMACSSPSASGPVLKDNVYNHEAHKSVEKAIAKRDFALATLLLRQPREKESASIVSAYTLFGGVQRHLVYHASFQYPLPEGLKWINKRASGRLYERVTEGRIRWYTKVVRGDILPFMREYFEEELSNGIWISDVDYFARKAAFFIKSYPCEEHETYESFLEQFDTMLSSAKPNLAKEGRSFIIRRIAMHFGRLRVLYNHLQDVEYYQEIAKMSTRLTAIECSRRVHKSWVE